MAILTGDQIKVGSDGERVALKLPIDGRDRLVKIAPLDALRIANTIALAAVQCGDPPAGNGLETVTDMRLRPYDEGGRAYLLLTTVETGPLSFALTPQSLVALSSAAAAALELGKVGGTG